MNFSNKNTRHDSEEQLRSKYNTFNEHHDRPVKINTLYYYAKEDNQPEFSKILQENKLFGKFELTSQFIAEYIRLFRGHDFIWNNGVLYSFNGKYWEADEDQTIMRSYIGKELYKSLYEIYLYCYHDHLTTEQGNKMQGNLKKLQGLPFKKEIVETTKEIMTNNNDIFDNKPYLFGFTNVVYDLNVGQFRSYQRSDMVSLTTGYDWKEPTTEEINTMNELM